MSVRNAPCKDNTIMGELKQKLDYHIRNVSLRLSRWLDNTNLPEWATVMGTALIVGIGTGLGAVIFHRLIGVAEVVFFEWGARGFAFMGDYYILVIPALGGLVGGPLVYYFAREAKGHGVPEVMEAVALRGGRIRPRVAVIKSLASSVCIGSGGSVGSEGPIVQIGSAIGSTVGQVLHLSEDRVRSLVACGAAGGIAAVFNAPIAGTIFALEVILGEFSSTYFGAVVISAVMADVVVHIFKGAERAFTVPAYELVHPVELVFYALLGITAALVAVLYSKSVDGLEGVFDNWKWFPEPLKASVGGLGVGMVGALLIWVSTNHNQAAALAFAWQDTGSLMPSVYGTGYTVVNPALLGQISVGVAFILMLLKLLVTALTLGSGGSGGIFAPGLFIGAMLGVVFGNVVHELFPAITGPVGAYALVGMAAVFAGAAHAPATAILILFEMTGDYNIILPLMLATVISLIMSRALEAESIYTMKLSRRGIRLEFGRDVDLMAGVTVSAVMQDYDSIPPDMPLNDLITEFERTHHHGYPILDADGVLLGVVTLTDLDRAIQDHQIEGRTAMDIATVGNLVVAYPDESLGTVLLRMGVRGIGRVPVVTREMPHRFLGILRRESLVNAYNRAIARRTNLSHRLNALHQHGSDKISILEIEVTPDMPCAGQELHDVATRLPNDCIIASILRENRTLIPHGYTLLLPGDHLTVLAGVDIVDTVRDAFCKAT